MYTLISYQHHHRGDVHAGSAQVTRGSEPGHGILHNQQKSSNTDDGRVAVLRRQSATWRRELIY